MRTAAPQRKGADKTRLIHVVYNDNIDNSESGFSVQQAVRYRRVQSSFNDKKDIGPRRSSDEPSVIEHDGTPYYLYLFAQ
jgi:hypothetical protein